MGFQDIFGEAGYMFPRRPAQEVAAARVLLDRTAEMFEGAEIRWSNPILKGASDDFKVARARSEPA